jgi:hypothetical protein
LTALNYIQTKIEENIIWVSSENAEVSAIVERLTEKQM